MRSSVYHGPGRIDVAARATPRAAPGELIVEVKACGVCGTDVHILDGEFPATSGIALGHEYAGVVHEVGAGVTGVAPGDAVAVDPNIACGACPACRRGDVHLCDHLEALGVTRDGGFAEFSRVPAGQAYRLPPRLSFEAAALAEPLSCCLHGLDLAGIRAGDRVAIIGAGPIGLLMIQLVRASGAAAVAVIEPVPGKRALALEVGADRGLDPAAPDLAAACREAAPAGFDAVLECVGRPDTAAQALGLARRGGTVVWFGVSPPGATVAVEPYLVYRNELTIRAAFVNPRTFGRAIALLAEGRIQTAPLISHRFDLASLPEGIATVKAGRAVKALVLL
jgi:threonine dehydrogenase-like Zn-dependent dehydrogenase